MLGSLLDDPGLAETAARRLSAIGDPDLVADVTLGADLLEMDVGAFAAISVRRFAARADAEAWAMLLSAMNRSEDPGAAALRFILRRAADDARAALA